MVTVIHTPEFKAWFDGLAQQDAAAVLQSVKLLEAMGVQLAYPHSKPLHHKAYAFRELRPTGGRSGTRVIYIFDPSRNAVLLIGGSKTDAKLYERLLKRAKKIWEALQAD